MKASFNFGFLLFALGFSTHLIGCAQSVSDSSSSTAITTNSTKGIRYVNQLRGNFSALFVDVLGNIYTIDAGNRLKKVNSRGDSIGVFNDVKRYGNPSFIDVSNPLKILVYYQNFSTVVVLDRLLTLRNTINFRKANIFSVKTLGTSYDNKIWLFDEQDYKLKKIDEEGNVILETNDWRLIMKEVPSPEKIIDHNNFVYLYDPEKGFYIFDYYGSYKNNLPFKGWDHVAVSGENIYGFKDGKLFSYQQRTLQLKSFDLPESFKPFTDVVAMNGKLYLLKPSGIFVFEIE